VDETMGLVPNHEFIKINTKSPVLLMLKLSSTRSGVGLLKIGLSLVMLDGLGQASIA
jgi:hypothetical protein